MEEKIFDGIALGTRPALDAGFRLVLNGGNQTLDSATVPIQWYFGPNLIEKKPTHLLIVEQNEKEIAEDEYLSSGVDSRRRGRRYIVPVSQATFFMQFFSPGRHRLIFCAVACDERAFEQTRKEFFGQSRRNEWSYGILTSLDNPDFQLNCDLCAANIVEVEIPPQFFARKDDTQWRRALWSFANRWHESNPVDECAFRRRVITAFLFTWWLMILGWIFMFFWNIAATLWLIAARTFVAYIGFRPTPFFGEIGKIWTNWSFNRQQNVVDWDIRLYGRRGEYKVWKFRDDSHWLGVEKKLRFTALEITLVLSLFVFGSYCLYYFFTARYVAVGLTLGIIFRWLFWDKIEQSHETRKTRRQVREVQKVVVDPYTQWMKTEIPESGAPSKVNLKNGPKPYNHRFIHRFYVGYWGTKAKVCKPFAQD